MRKYLIKSFYFSIPFLVYFLFIFIIDPYEFINVFHVIDKDTKIKVFRRSDESSPRGTMLWKVLHFKREPKKSVLFGDSQGGRIRGDYVEELCGEKLYNFCIPGASYETVFETFWFAVEQIKPENVYFQVAFMNYNSNRSYNLFHFASDYFREPYLYFTTKEIFFDSFINFLYSITKNEKLVKHSYEYAGKDGLDKKSKESLELFFSDYNYPAEYYNELLRITDYCNDNNINLSFIIIPNYEAVDDYLQKNDLYDMRLKFKEDIKSFGKTYDFNLQNKISKKRDNFSDYFHPTQPVIDEITKEIWGR
ncbi:MAG: hypothetical protein B6D61_13625 [Bacteroidetes bacterium 4484_249]|nr:MAG: hypothetical protein B6D61_13625 [Bacteroidetes bacterium 4484_249]